MKNCISAVVFDLDGTLVDSLTDIAAATNWVLRQHGYPEHSSERYRYFVGDGIEQLLVRALPTQARLPDIITECLSQLKQRYQTHWAVETRPYDGTMDLLDRLDTLGLPMLVLSNKPDLLTREVVDHFFGLGRFKSVRGARPDLPLKPDPTAVLSMLGDLELDPKQVIYLGDSAVDMTLARRAEMVPVGAAWGFRSVDELHSSGARFIIHHPLDLPDLLEENQPG
ncbi:HAD family hydrolase [bacterium]|nr:HAD family hydrolase [bacterium]